MVSELFPLTVRGAEVRRRGKCLVGPVDLVLPASGVTVVIGPNGSGKTSLLGMLHGIKRLAAGSVDWACPLDRARLLQAFVFQPPVVLRRSVRGNIEYPLRLRGTGRSDARQKADEWAAKVGLGDKLDQQATKLSSGEKQKLAIARSLVLEPALLFLDEPCASLDGRATREIEGILNAATQAGTRLIMSTHDMGQARRLATEVIFVLGGRVHEFTPAAQFFAQPQTPEAAGFLNGDIIE